MREYNQNPDFGPLFSAVTAMVSPAHKMITQQPLYEQVTPLEFRPGFKPIARRFTDQISQWHRRTNERKALMNLDDRMLLDIGVERVQVQAEWEKPFWQD